MFVELLVAAVLVSVPVAALATPASSLSVARAARALNATTETSDLTGNGADGVFAAIIGLGAVGGVVLAIANGDDNGSDSN